MDIVEVNPRQLAPSVGIEGAGIMNSAAPSSSTSNSKIGGGQIRFGTIDFLLHPPARLPAFVDLDQEMDLTFGSFNFLVRAK